MATYKTPGVYIEEVPQIVLSIADVETAIPAFIGYTQITNRQGSVMKPVRITSLLEYTAVFGTATNTEFTIEITDVVSNGVVISRETTSDISNDPQDTMYYHMQMYFANGGGPCYIVSLGRADGTIAAADFNTGLAAIALEDEPTLLVFPNAVQFLTATQLYDLYDLALVQCATLKDRFAILDCKDNDVSTLRNTLTGIGNNNLKYGAAYHPYLITTLNYNYTDDTVKIKHIYQDTYGTELANALYPISNIPNYILSNVLLDKSNIYQIGKQGANSFRITLNPSSAVAGIYVATDNTRGVWKAPANASLSNVIGLTKFISEEEQSRLNVDTTAGKSVNAIRAFVGKGTLVWGARTLAGNDGEWRYVSVRRLFNLVEESIKKTIESFVFESNDAGTWVKIKSLLNNFLTTLWRAGAMQGNSEEEAFYVAVGLRETMNAQDILEGRLLVEVGLAAVRPAEFIVIRFSHTMAES